MNKQLGGLGGMEDLVRQAKKIQGDLGKVQEQLKTRVVEAAASGGLVKVQINGAREVLSVKIDKSVVDPEDIGLLEDMVIAGVNAALKKAEEMINKEMGKVSPGLNLPGLM